MVSWWFSGCFWFEPFLNVTSVDFWYFRFMCLIPDVTKLKKQITSKSETNIDNFCNQNNVLADNFFISKVQFQIWKLFTNFVVCKLDGLFFQVGTFRWPCIPNCWSRCGDLSTSDTTNAPWQLHHDPLTKRVYNPNSFSQCSPYWKKYILKNELAELDRLIWLQTMSWYENPTSFWILNLRSPDRTKSVLSEFFRRSCRWSIGIHLEGWHQLSSESSMTIFPNVLSKYCWWFRNPAKQLRLVVYPIIYRVL